MYSSTQKIAICGSNVCIWTCFGFDCDVCWRRRSSGGSAAGSRPTRQRHESAVGKLRGVEGTKDDLAWNNKNGDLTNEKIIVMMMMMMMMMHIFFVGSSRMWSNTNFGSWPANDGNDACTSWAVRPRLIRIMDEHEAAPILLA